MNLFEVLKINRKNFDDLLTATEFKDLKENSNDLHIATEYKVL